ncbi:sensor histidine kinase [Paenibacillus ginsengarvi]|nr:sensor histidine kinase [Paenibacillus ginsengarvi]
MNNIRSFILVSLLAVLLCLIAAPKAVHAGSASGIAIQEWQFRWESEPVRNPDKWSGVTVSDPIPANPANATSARIKIDLPKAGPDTAWNQPGIFIDQLYGHHIQIFAGERLIYETSRNYAYDVHKIALPLERSDLGGSVYVKVDTLSDRIGIHDRIELNNYTDGLYQFYKIDWLDLMLGGSLVFFGTIMLLCSTLLRRSYLARWISLSLVIFTTGTLIVTFSPLPYTFFSQYGTVWLTIFDCSLYVFLPSLAIFIEKALDSQSNIIAYSRKVTVAYSSFCIALLAFNLATTSKYISIYYFFSLTVLGIVMISLFAVLITTTVVYAIKKNRDALIMCTGFALFALTAIGELVFFYGKSKNYDIFLWKWGLLCFIVAFIIILTRGFARDHEKVVRYSKELELFNNRLQRQEKMEIISELAASVAHEVRNPLQVTRGFLQLLRETAEEKPKKYLGFAMDELDRASEIITDFLTFAKPQLDDITVLSLSAEFEHIEGILRPMANIQGGDIRVQLPTGLYVKGNSSKLKQAFVNMVKNSIEALEDEGVIQIWAYREREDVVIHIKDNGAGMDEHELSRLGEPYFSSKSKGTGLGLMVTFRIIEVMQGKIEFKSTKGVGTEAIIRFPSAD